MARPERCLGRAAAWEHGGTVASLGTCTHTPSLSVAWGVQLLGSTAALWNTLHYVRLDILFLQVDIFCAIYFLELKLFESILNLYLC